MSSSNMIELRDLLAPQVKIRHDSSFLSPAQIANASRAPRFSPSPNGAIVNAIPSLSPLTLIAIGGRSPATMSDLSGKFDLSQLTTPGLILGSGGDRKRRRRAYYAALQQQATQEAEQAQIEAAAAAAATEAKEARHLREIAIRDEAVARQQKKLLAQSQAQEAAQAQVARERAVQEAALQQAVKIQQQRQEEKLESQHRKFLITAQEAAISQEQLNRQLDASRWAQQQRDEMAQQASRTAALQAQLQTIRAAQAVAPVPSPMPITLTLTAGSPGSSPLLPEGGSPVVDLSAPVQQFASAQPEEADRLEAPAQDWMVSEGESNLTDYRSANSSQSSDLIWKTIAVVGAIYGLSCLLKLKD